MKLLRLKTIFIVTTFTSAVLFADDKTTVPPAVSAAEGSISSPVAPAPEVTNSSPAPSVVDGPKTSPSVEAMDSIPNVPTKKEVDRSTDIFLKGGFCVITAVLFLVGFLVVKTNPGQKV